MGNDQVIKGSKEVRYPVVKGIVVSTDREDSFRLMDMRENIFVNRCIVRIPFEKIVIERFPGFQFPGGLNNRFFIEAMGSEVDNSLIGLLETLLFILLLRSEVADTDESWVFKMLS
jgi:hypothetical protein